MTRHRELRQRWLDLWRRLDRPAPEALGTELVRRWCERHRRYHGAAHLLDVLAKAEGCREIQERPEEVDLALWFHDAIYQPMRHDNEARSAELAHHALQGLGFDAATIERVARLVLDTRHDVAPSSRDGEIVVDVDLSILGADEPAYDRYAAAVRAEYRWVPMALYRKARMEVLQGFLDREKIFRTGPFRSSLEDRARRNLERELASLRRAPARL